ncbi:MULTISPECIES: pyridoxamine 5'-phosphate oxidase family protein [Clostridium]|uniref:pyridoxamine 5'-phosphate oxidase family protein n=1 Tax=Clostridium TaxID=1485 RepID=UPI00082557BF|nr:MULTISPECIES: pyridoxamine 5'-phosphate oxidase family protein [Clostridium]PJI08433.1 NimC/NimA family protein [Clostridium sp. CT7]
MNKIVEALKKTGVFYISTVEGDKPHVRPFSSVCEFEGKAYICTNNTKKCYAQMINNPKIEISGMGKDGTWIRLTGKLVRDDRDEARAAMLADPTGPSKLYKLGDGIFEVFYIDNASCTQYSFKGDPVKII